MPQPIRIVLIDDHRTLLWGLERLIEGEHPRMQVVGAATNCRDGLAIVHDTRPDVVLLDIYLGIEDGIDAVPELLDRGAARVLVLTGEGDAAMHDKAVIAGARGVIGKDHDPDDILKAIEKVHGGELWLDRISTSRVFTQLSRRRSEEDNDPEQQKISLLTPRERSIVREMVFHAGATTKAIADKLFISDRTLRNHLTSIYGKLGVANRLELLVYASKRGLGDADA
jgi:two-component system, NarL family, nitrate/nitrite response regulator NarL